MMSLRGLILHNFWLKLCSIALATVIWLAIHYSIHGESPIGPPGSNQLLAHDYFLVPVTVKRSPGDKRLFRIDPTDVVVTAVGDDAALRRAARKAIRVEVDLTNFKSHSAVVEELKAEVPPDIKVLEINPTNVTVEDVSPQE
jgi:hypothetical protein